MRSLESGHTTEAIEIYEQLIAAGARDSALYYNLGNAYYRQGRHGQRRR
ncbi:MAG: tetratricopeptide repeat protein [Chloroflexota bacterium]